MRHPALLLDPTARRRVFPPLATATLAVGAVLAVMGQPLHTDAAPLGVFSYELAFTREAAEAMLSSFAGHETALGFQLGFDYLFMPLYGLAIGWAMLLRGEHAPRWAHLLAWAQVGAAGLDAVENVALVRMALHGATTLDALVAGWTASAKFALIALGLVAWPYLAWTARGR